MLRLTVNPDTLFFTNSWSFYVHLQSVSATFNFSFIKIAEIRSVADYWRVMNNIPSCKDLHTNTVLMDGKRIIAYSFFKEDITPEWEHPINNSGCEWGCRDEMSAEFFSDMFLHLTLCAINCEMDDVVGIRCINKCNKLRNLHKLEIWMQCNDEQHTDLVKSKINEVSYKCDHTSDVIFTLLHHEDKQLRANEYSKKKTKPKKNQIRFQ